MKRNDGFLRLMLTVGIIMSVLSTACLAHAWTLTGSPITNETGKSGRMFFSVVDQYGNQVAGGVAPSGSTSGTIRGVPSGSFTVNAFIDTQGTGFQHANDPAFSSGQFPVSADSTGPVTFANPTPVSAVAPGKPQVMPVDGAAFVMFDAPTTNNNTNNNLPIADSYDIYWSTSDTPGPGNTAGGGQLQVKNGKAPQIIYGLTNGTQYYFAVRAVVTSDSSSALSAVSDPVTINPLAAGASTVNVTVDTTGIAKNNTPLIIALTDNGNKAFLNYVRTSNDIQTVAIPGVTAGTYKIYAILDLDGNGNLTALANPSNLNEADRNQRPVPIMVDGVTSVVTGPTVKLALKKAGVSVGTVHSIYGGIESYSLSFKVVQMNRQLASVTLDGGPHVAGPVDIGSGGNNSDNVGAFELRLPVNSRPAVGDTYSFTLTYADGAQETETRTATVTAVLDVFPGGIFPSGSIGPGAVSLLAWNNPGNLPGFLTTNINLNNLNAEFLPLSALSVPYQESQFATGQGYSWNRTVQDLDGNQTQSSLSFTPNANGPIIVDFTPKSGPAGTSVTITGSGFDSTPANNMVQFNGMTATVTAASPTSLTVTAPGSSGVITVNVGGVTAGSSVPFAATVNFTLTLTEAVNGTTPLISATATVVENPTLSTTTNTNGVYVLTVPARPYFSMVFSQAGHYPTYSPLLSLSADTSSGWSLYTSSDLTARGISFSPGKGVMASRVQDATQNGSGNLGGAVVTATSLLHPDVPYTVRYTNGSIAVDPAATATASDGRYYVLDVDEGDFVTVTASKAGMGFQSRLFNTHAGAVSAGAIKGALVLVSLPTASPAGGAYASTQNVTLNNPDSANYNIFYTTDGSDPALFGKQYFGAITISSTSTLKFVAKNKWVGQAVGSVQTQVYTIQTTPVINWFNPNGGVPGTQVTIGGSSFDATTPSNNIVHFPGTTTLAPVVSASQNQLVVTVPGDATPANGPITVTAGGLTGSSGTNNFAVTTTISMSGTVKEAGAGNVSGATIQLDNNALVPPTTSDVNGDFTLNGLPSNASFTIKTSKATYADSYQDSWSNQNITGTVVVLYKSPLSSTLGTVAGTGVIRVRVMNSANGTPLAGAAVTISPAGAGQVVYGGTDPDSLPDLTKTSTQANGIFYVRNVSPNNFVNFTVTLNGFSFPGQFGASARADAVTDVAIYGADLTPFIGFFYPNAGVPGTQVTIYGNSFDGTTPGNNIVHFTGTTTPATVVAAFQNMLVVNAPAGTQTGPIMVTVGSRTGSSGANNFTVTSTISVTGTVKEAGLAGNLLGATVQLNNNPLVPPATWDGTGIFTLNGAPSNAPFTLKASMFTYADTYQDFWSNQNFDVGKLVLYKSPISSTLGNAPGTGLIRGRVVNNANGNPLVGATVTVSPANAGQVVYGGTAPGSPPDTNLISTQTNGIFYIRNVSQNNPWNFTVSLAGFSFPGQLGAASYADAVTQVEIYGTPPNFNLTANITGSGNVNSVNPSSANFGCFSPSCTNSYAQGTSFTLHANPNPSATFTGWSGACSGTGDCAITLNADTTVNANFTQAQFDTTPPFTTVSQLGGTFAGPISVTLSANEPATIYYTTDGSDPVASVTKQTYSAVPILISTTTTLKFYAVDTEGNPETVKSTTYTITAMPGLVAMWRMDEGAGNTAADATGANNGTLINAPLWVQGKSGTALNFNGATQYVNAKAGAILGSAPNFTIEAWIKWDGATTAQPQQMIYGEGSFNDIVDLYLDGGVPSFTTLSGNWATAKAAAQLPAGGWHHLSAVLESGVGGKLYVDGQLAAANPFMGAGSQFAGETDIGRFAGNGGSRYFSGAIDEVRVFNTAKSASEILTDYQSSADTTPPVTSASPAGGNFPIQVSVTLNVNEPATIFYTTDGSDPMTSGTKQTYSAVPILISATTTLKFYARDAAGNNETVQTQVYTINTGGTPALSASLSLINFGNVAVGTTSSTQTLTFTNTGTANLSVTSSFMSGADVAMFTLFPIGANPCPQLPTTFTPGQSCTLGVTFTPTLAGGRSATMTVNSNDPVTPNLPVQFSGSGIVVDNVPPALTSVHIGSGNGAPARAKIGDTVIIVIGSSEPITQPTVTIAGHPAAVAGSGQNWTATYTMTSGDAEGAVGFSIAGYADLASNAGATVSATTDLSSVTFDKTAPALNLSTQANGAATNNATLNVSGTVSDANGIQNLAINGMTVPVNIDGSFSHAHPLSSGANIITAIATDSAGNQTTDTRTITYDPIAPVLTVTAPADNSKINSTFVAVTGSVNENSTVTVNGASATMNGTNFSATVNLVSGLNSIDIVATDLAGNTTSAVRTVTSDTGAPSLAITNPPQDTTTTQSSMTISGTVSDALTAVTMAMSCDGQNYTPQVTNGTFSQTVTFATYKTYSVTVTATDEAGNQATVTRNIIVSNAVPSGPTVDLGTAGGSKGGTVTVPITLTNVAGTDLSGVSMDIGYDTTLLSNPTATIGPAGTAAGKTISTSTPAAGQFRVGVVGVNTTAIGNGVVANVTFTIAPTATAGTSTPLTNTPGATDPTGSTVAATGKNGTVNVITKAGDCDGNGSVSIAEVQSAINMFLGMKTVASCVDVDGIGGVSIAEVQKSINSFLGL